MFVNTQVPGITSAISGPWSGVPANIPESPLAVMMPVAAAAVLVGGMVAFRRRGEHVDVTPA